MSKPRIVPEFQRRVRKPRAGFVPGHYEGEETVELWTLWCHSDEPDKDHRRATTADMRAAGYARKKR